MDEKGNAGRTRTVNAMIAVAVVAIALVIITSGYMQYSNRMDASWTMVTFSTSRGNATFECEVADSYEERAEGLMNRESLDSDAGMLFVFDEPTELTFWMKNTLIPLDIIFVAENGTVLNIARAVPEPGVPDAELTRYSSAGPALWVVEVNSGACEENGIIPGSSFSVEYPDM